MHDRRQAFLEPILCEFGAQQQINLERFQAHRLKTSFAAMPIRSERLNQIGNHSRKEHVTVFTTF
jgi:hypothetical protein